jgi:hypothetical protein
MHGEDAPASRADDTESGCGEKSVMKEVEEEIGSWAGQKGTECAGTYGIF